MTGWEIGVLVPARDEEQRIGGCLTAVAAAVVGLPARVCVVADRCRDATAEIAAAHGVEVLVNAADLAIGSVRNLAAGRLMDGRRLDRLWLLSTDADTLVPPTWARDHLRHALAGAAAVAGAADLDQPHRLDPGVLARYTALIDHATQEHAYAANIGVRADAFAQVGGFPPVVHGEEHALLAHLRHRGYPVRRDVRIRVCTSARTVGRATGGLADLLRSLS